MNYIQKAFVEMQRVLTHFSTEENFKSIETAACWMAEALQQGGKIISCGNGGSMADAMHFAEELSGRFREDRPGLAAISISDPTHLSCVANDYGYDYVFSRYVEAIGRKGDVLLAISTSGNSVNVCKVAEVAQAKGMRVVALTGKDGGKLKTIADLELRVPHDAYADRIQEIHIKIIHLLIQGIELKMFDNHVS
jgi:D-sedoheptulose 7-phosphate isomerase